MSVLLLVGDLLSCLITGVLECFNSETEEATFSPV